MKIKRTVNVETNDWKIGDKVIFGNTEWKVLDVKDNKALIWKCTNVKDHVFNENNKKTYEGSDIQKYLQNDFKKSIPMDILENVTDDGFFLLTIDQIKKYIPKEIDRIVTDEDDQTTWYWTASPSIYCYNTVRYVELGGEIADYYANASYGVAPACWLKIKL